LDIFKANREGEETQMKLLRQALGGLGALTVLAVILAFIAPKTAHALAAALVQIVPGTTTHVGQNESQLVSLTCPPGINDCSAIDPEGNASTSAYVVPAGYPLILTDYQASLYFPGYPNKQISDFLFDQTASNALMFTEGLTDKDGVGYGHEHLVAGVRVASGVTPIDLDASSGDTSAWAQGTSFRTSAASPRIGKSRQREITQASNR
jgi:hypothetical protein